ncbi:unnamed protein product [Acanthosepion pharaonis]|uniref:Uncharacterized protein n=1 Tax=Acanthosepion pharaonis TaxID=158019 RepID=A0A812E2Q8_ACAPH|nr:unnamed protein product [Sepia pharaonis]
MSIALGDTVPHSYFLSFAEISFSAAHSTALIVPHSYFLSFVEINKSLLPIALRTLFLIHIFSFFLLSSHYFSFLLPIVPHSYFLLLLRLAAHSTCINCSSFIFFSFAETSFSAAHSTAHTHCVTLFLIHIFSFAEISFSAAHSTAHTVPHSYFSPFLRQHYTLFLIHIFSPLPEISLLPIALHETSFSAVGTGATRSSFIFSPFTAHTVPHSFFLLLLRQVSAAHSIMTLFLIHIFSFKEISFSPPLLRYFSPCSCAHSTAHTVLIHIFLQHHAHCSSFIFSPLLRQVFAAHSTATLFHSYFLLLLRQVSAAHSINAHCSHSYFLSFAEISFSAAHSKQVSAAHSTGAHCSSFIFFSFVETSFSAAHSTCWRDTVPHSYFLSFVEITLHTVPHSYFLSFAETSFSAAHSTAHTVPHSYFLSFAEISFSAAHGTVHAVPHSYFLILFVVSSYLAVGVPCIVHPPLKHISTAGIACLFLGIPASTLPLSSIYRASFSCQQHRVFIVGS